MPIDQPLPLLVATYGNEHERSVAEGGNGYAGVSVGAVRIDSMRCKYTDADQNHDTSRDLNHYATSCLCVAARCRPRNWLQVKSKKNCMMTSLFHH